MTDKRKDIEPITLEDAMATIAILSNYILRLLEHVVQAQNDPP